MNYILLIQILVYFYVVLDRHCNKPKYHPAVSIYCCYMCHTIHDQLLVLVNMKLMTNVISMVWNRVGLPSCFSLSSIVVAWADPAERFSNSLLTDMKTTGG